MPSSSPISDIKRALAAYRRADDAVDRLDAARVLREAADALEADAIRAARKTGATWATIGARYGLSKQGAQQRFRH